MPTPTYTPLANITLGSSASSVTFSNIPNTYRDLILISSVQQNTTSDRQSELRPNNSTTNASLVYMDGSGSSAASGTTSNLSLYYVASGAPANTPVTSIAQIFDYAQTDKHKTILVRAGSSYNPVSAYASRWASTTAISSLVIFPNIGPSLSAGSTFALYGVIA